MAESFGADAERYDRTRPRYPQAMVDAIIAATPGRDVLDGASASAFPLEPSKRPGAGCSASTLMREWLSSRAAVGSKLR